MIDNQQGYQPTEWTNRSLERDGDVLEKFAYPVIKEKFPKYEELWKKLIWDITDRDFIPNEGQPRETCPENLRIFAQAHYTFLRSFVFIYYSIKYKTLETRYTIGGHSFSVTPEFNTVYINERLLNIYAHFGRMRDVLYLMLECIAKEKDTNTNFRKSNSKEFDRDKILNNLIQIKNNETVLKDNFCSWEEEISNYRNLLHTIAHAVKWEQEEGKYKDYILRPNKLKNFGDWVYTLKADKKDSISVDEILNRHFDQMIKIFSEIWKYFIKVVDEWRQDKVEFHKRLGLPELGSIPSKISSVDGMSYTVSASGTFRIFGGKDEEDNRESK